MHKPEGTPRTNSSARWTGQKCVTNSRAAVQGGWLVECSPNTPGLPKQYTKDIDHISANPKQESLPKPSTTQPSKHSKHSKPQK